MVIVLEATVVLIHTHGEGLLRPFLANHKTIQIFGDLVCTPREEKNLYLRWVRRTFPCFRLQNVPLLRRFFDEIPRIELVATITMQISRSR